LYFYEKVIENLAFIRDGDYLYKINTKLENKNIKEDSFIIQFKINNIMNNIQINNKIIKNDFIKKKSKINFKKGRIKIFFKIPILGKQNIKCNYIYEIN
jgi:hypothetical protein